MRPVSEVVCLQVAVMPCCSPMQAAAHFVVVIVLDRMYRRTSCSTVLKLLGS